VVEAHLRLAVHIVDQRPVMEALAQQVLFPVRQLLMRGAVEVLQQVLLEVVALAVVVLVRLVQVRQHQEQLTLVVAVVVQETAQTVGRSMAVLVVLAS